MDWGFLWRDWGLIGNIVRFIVLLVVSINIITGVIEFVMSIVEEIRDRPARKRRELEIQVQVEETRKQEKERAERIIERIKRGEIVSLQDYRFIFPNSCPDCAFRESFDAELPDTYEYTEAGSGPISVNTTKSVHYCKQCHRDYFQSLNYDSPYLSPEEAHRIPHLPYNPKPQQ